MAVSFIRTIVMYLFVIFILRVMGKRQVGELQPSELVVAIMISDIASIPIQDTSTPLSVAFIAILTLLIGEVVLSFFSLKNIKFRTLLSGSPSILVERGIINESEMRKQRFNVNDLLEEIRTQGITNIQDVDFAILETNGRISIFQNALARPVNAQDLNLNPPPVEISYTIISDGKINDDNLKKLGFNREWLDKQLKINEYNSPKEVFFMSSDKMENIYITSKEQKRT